ncbi:GNAT family N-acetyltransferase [Psychromarinibacter sp. C21-152]|uniref:GNAT family N-acetyltransferase n=1 Tax=Psychromarinibacter sediminicola TaxID=3033385 RepID=A0AAE3T8F7_9RHOB|nr:GNAT family N-acetyltransferase [Psychromarinibacter sediminicola]MDF0601370.1 GNAT family N-acetyltransferase [Psychromarinibacter sediminicola]
MTHQDHMRDAETIELAALSALHGAADGPLRDRLGLRLVEVADGVASVAGALPASAITINRMMGLGRARPPQVGDVRAAVDLYRGAGVRRFFLQPDPATSDDRVAPLCRAAGLERARAWQKFERGRDAPVPDVECEFTIRKAAPDDGDAFARIVCDAFDLGDAALPWIARLPAAEGWHAYLAWAGDRPAGAGAVFVSDGAAFTDFGATAPDYRGRGAQTANLAHRVRAALEMGCRRIYTCTGVAVEGDPQHSYANIRKCGFAEAHVRAAWQPVQGDGKGASS